MMGEEEAAAEGGGLPSSRHPSDHLPLAADLSLDKSMLQDVLSQKL